MTVRGEWILPPFAISGTAKERLLPVRLALSIAPAPAPQSGGEGGGMAARLAARCSLAHWLTGEGSFSATGSNSQGQGGGRRRWQARQCDVIYYIEVVAPQVVVR